MTRTWFIGVAAATLLACLALPATAQKDRKSDEDFVMEKPAVGELLPDVTVYDPDGKEFKTTDLRGHYTVLTFGCLT
jgi:cytochrome oxidase Cu insertion factor (SCO1/SenC/PrrC family)